MEPGRERGTERRSLLGAGLALGGLAGLLAGRGVRGALGVLRTPCSLPPVRAPGAPPAWWLADRGAGCFLGLDARGRPRVRLGSPGPRQVLAAADGGAWCLERLRAPCHPDDPGCDRLLRVDASGRERAAWELGRVDALVRAAGTGSGLGMVLCVERAPPRHRLVAVELPAGGGLARPRPIGVLDGARDGEPIVARGVEVLRSSSAGRVLTLSALEPGGTVLARAVADAGRTRALAHAGPGRGWWSLESASLVRLVRWGPRLERLAERSLPFRAEHLLGGDQGEVWAFGGRRSAWCGFATDGWPGACGALDLEGPLLGVARAGDALALALPACLVVLGVDGRVGWTQGGFVALASVDGVPG